MTESRGRVLGIDYGSKRVGLALSDPMRILAGGAGTVANTDALVQHIARIVREQGVSLIVVGIPFAPDGGKGAKGEEVEQFIGRLRHDLNIPISTWDESYSTREAARVMRAGGMKRRQRQQRIGIDEMAARVLLQEFLDQHVPSSHQ